MAMITNISQPLPQKVDILKNCRRPLVQTIQIVNLYYVNNPSDDEWVLVDAGMPKSANKIIDTVNENFSKPPVAIVLTHGHFDHVGAIIELVDYWKIPVYAHEYELPYLQGELKYPEPDPTVEGGMVAKLSPLFPVEPINLGDKVQPLQKTAVFHT